MYQSATPLVRALSLALFVVRAVGADLITPSTSSELVDLEPAWEDTTSAIAAAVAECPHEGDGLALWHDALTWSGGALPAAGDDVVIPPDTKVLVTRSPLSDAASFGKVSVPSTSELIFGENSSGIAFGATGFEVNGSLRAGAPGCRISSPIRITLRGDRPTSGPGGEISQPAWVKGIYSTLVTAPSTCTATCTAVRGLGSRRRRGLATRPCTCNTR